MTVATTAFVLSSGAAKADLCTLDRKPVCANDHGVKKTFSNACWAKAWGAKVLYSGECGKRHHMKAHKKAAEKKDAPAKAEPAKKEPAKAAPAKKEEKK